MCEFKFSFLITNNNLSNAKVKIFQVRIISSLSQVWRLTYILWLWGNARNGIN